MNPITDFDALRVRLREAKLTRESRIALQRELAEYSTPADRADLEAVIRRLPAEETAEIRDLVFR